MPETHRIELNGTPVGVHEQGVGKPILFLHGIGSSCRSFDAQFAYFSTTHRCLAWDAPGYASSGDPRSAPGIDGYAAAAAQLLDRLGAAPAHVVGVSWGGVIATRLALRHPRAVATLVLADSTPGSASDPDRADAMRRRGDELDAAGPLEFARARARRLVSPSASAELVQAVVDNMSRSIRNPGYRFAAESMAETDHTDELAAITVPTLVLVGEHDQVTGVEASRRLAELVPGARFEILAGAGHLANQERAEAFDTALTQFLAENSAAAIASTSGGART